MKIAPASLHALSMLAAMLVAGTIGAGCVASPASDSDDVDEHESTLLAAPHAFDVGMSNEFAPYLTYRADSKTPASETRLCHVYTRWDVALEPTAQCALSAPPGGNPTETIEGLTDWMAEAASTCSEVLVTFKGPGNGDVISPPAPSCFEHAFVDFQKWMPAHWGGNVSYTAWNEPNNPGNAGNGLNHDLPAETAAEYYLRARRHCDSASCKIAAGDFATNTPYDKDIEWNCANDTDLINGNADCAEPSSFNHTGLPTSYLDRYKHFIVKNVVKLGLPSGFRPKYWAYHPWHDVNSYIDNDKPCTDYDTCVTRRLLTSLRDGWRTSDIWDTEISVGLQNSGKNGGPPPPNEHTTQPCGAAFLVRLTDLSPRITRLYYMHFANNPGQLLDGASLRAAGTVLGKRETSYKYAGGKCADTGIVMGQ